MSMAVVRMNPMHLGHKYLIEEMGKLSEHVYIGLGSCQESRTLKNPYTPKEREEMIRNIFPDKDKYHIFFLNDHPNMSKKEWQTYCLNELRSQCGVDYNPSRYFGGCESDLEWWQNSINLNGEEIEVLSLCRADNHYISATRIRESLRIFLQGKKFSVEWVKNIPEENLEYVENKYPKKLIGEFKNV